jgi:GNAT superfamily N-acetyltransferase
LLNVLAVDRKYHRQGIGKWLLLDTITKIVQVSMILPLLKGLILQPYDDKAKEYYLALNMGFREIGQSLLLPIETIRQMIKLADEDEP